MKKTKFYTYKFGKDFDSEGGALTLNPEEVCRNYYDAGNFKRIHPDGWTIEGVIHEDYYYWVNDFKASHKTLGKVWGNFEDKVYATKRKGFNDFYKKHKPQAWDYGDI